MKKTLFWEHTKAPLSMTDSKLLFFKSPLAEAESKGLGFGGLKDISDFFNCHKFTSDL